MKDALKGWGQFFLWLAYNAANAWVLFFNVRAFNDFHVNWNAGYAIYASQLTIACVWMVAMIAQGLLFLWLAVIFTFPNKRHG